MIELAITGVTRVGVLGKETIVLEVKAELASTPGRVPGDAAVVGVTVLDEKVVGTMVPKMDDAIPDILASAAISTPLQKPARPELWQSPSSVSFTTSSGVTALP